jgi:hypothetical protein
MMEVPETRGSDGVNGIGLLLDALERALGIKGTTVHPPAKQILRTHGPSARVACGGVTHQSPPCLAIARDAAYRVSGGSSILDSRR